MLEVVEVPKDMRPVSTEHNEEVKRFSTAQRISSVNSSDLSEYYNQMDKEFVTQEFLEVEAKVDKTFREIGGCGCFQVFAYLVIALGIHSQGFYIYMIGYYEQPPIYECTLKNMPIKTTCT